MAIAAYAPELREKSILALTWREHLNPAFTRITVAQHKTRRHTGRPQIVPVSVELQAILLVIRRAHPKATHVVNYRGRGIGRINRALATAVDRANAALPADEQIILGTKHGGITFHSIRHTLATWLAEWGESEAIRKLVMGHESLATTQKYTHMAAKAKEEPLARVAARLQLTEAVQGPVPTRERGRRGTTQEYAASRRSSPTRRSAVKS